MSANDLRMLLSHIHNADQLARDCSLDPPLPLLNLLAESVPARSPPTSFIDFPNNQSCVELQGLSERQWPPAKGVWFSVCAMVILHMIFSLRYSDYRLS